MLTRFHFKDTRNTESCPVELQISAGLDVLFHSMESLTAIPWASSFMNYLVANHLLGTPNGHHDLRIQFCALLIKGAIL